MSCSGFCYGSAFYIFSVTLFSCYENSNTNCGNEGSLVGLLGGERGRTHTQRLFIRVYLLRRARKNVNLSGPPEMFRGRFKTCQTSERTRVTDEQPTCPPFRTLKQWTGSATLGLCVHTGNLSLIYSSPSC